MFVLYIFTVGNGVLPADVAFVSLSLINVISFPIMFIPAGVQSLAQVGKFTEAAGYIHILSLSIMRVKIVSIYYAISQAPRLLKWVNFQSQQG